MLFLVAGLLTRPSVDRKGPGRFAADRLLRLGVPFVVFALLLWPLLEYALLRWLANAPELGEYLRAEGSLDTGVLWLVGALLVFSLTYAGWVAFRRRAGALRPRRRDIRFTDAGVLLRAGREHAVGIRVGVAPRGGAEPARTAASMDRTVRPAQRVRRVHAARPGPARLGHRAA